MTLNGIIDAVAEKLNTLWPDRLVYQDKIPTGADGNFFIGVIEDAQEHRLDRRLIRSVQLEVLYFRAQGGNIEYHTWAETMFEQFRYLTVDGRQLRLLHLAARRNDEARAYQCTFDIEINALEAHDTAPGMETLSTDTEIKEQNDAGT